MKISARMNGVVIEWLAQLTAEKFEVQFHAFAHHISSTERCRERPPLLQPLKGLNCENKSKKAEVGFIASSYSNIHYQRHIVHGQACVHCTLWTLLSAVAKLSPSLDLNACVIYYQQ